MQFKHKYSNLTWFDKELLKPIRHFDMINLINYVNAANAMADLQLKHRVRAIHEGAFADAIASIDPSRVVGRHPPLVDVGEKLLPRPFRTTLAQLRSGFSSAMGDYLFRIGRLPSPLCPSAALSTTRCRTFSTAPHVPPTYAQLTSGSDPGRWHASSLPCPTSPTSRPCPALPEPPPNAPSPPWQGPA